MSEELLFLQRGLVLLGSDPDTFEQLSVSVPHNLNFPSDSELLYGDVLELLREVLLLILNILLANNGLVSGLPVVRREGEIGAARRQRRREEVVHCFVLILVVLLLVV